MKNSTRVLEVRLTPTSFSKLTFVNSSELSRAFVADRRTMTLNETKWKRWEWTVANSNGYLILSPGFLFPHSLNNCSEDVIRMSDQETRVLHQTYFVHSTLSKPSTFSKILHIGLVRVSTTVHNFRCLMIPSIYPTFSTRSIPHV